MRVSQQDPTVDGTAARRGEPSAPASRQKRVGRTAGALSALVVGLLTLAALPLPGLAERNASLHSLQQAAGQSLVTVTDRLTDRLAPALERVLAKRTHAGRATPRAAPTQDPQRDPPLHGTNPHGQGSVGVTDLTPRNDRPLGGIPWGADSGEEIVVGRARGEQDAAGNYHGHITIAALFGNEILGVDTTPGQTRTGPLDAVQQGLLNPLCTGSGDQICASAVTADSTTTPTGTTNRYSTASAQLGGPTGLSAGAAESNGNISDDTVCQTAHGDTQVANVSAGGQAVASAARSSTESKACKGQAPSQQHTSSVLGLGGTGVPIPAAGCADGTPDTVTGIPTIAPVVCNADDLNAAQAAAPYGVREALSVFALAAGSMSVQKTATAASESLAVAPPPQCSDRRDNDGDGQIDFGPDPGCTSAADDDETDVAKPECSDGRDNDGDGKIDYPADKGCTSASDDSEAGGGVKAGAGKPECSDGKDNDGDGRIDYPADKGCTSSMDDSEAGGGVTTGAGRPECSDGIDNDGDGKVDFPADPQCSSAVDDSEAGGPEKAAATLPFTGSDVLVLLIGGLLLVGGGAALRRRLSSGAGR